MCSCVAEYVQLYATEEALAAQLELETESSEASSLSSDEETEVDDDV